MHIVSRRTLLSFWERHNQAERPLSAWYMIVKRAEWNSPADVKKAFGTAVDFVGDNRAIFDLAGNKYRLVAHIAYSRRRVFIKFVGTHAEYDRIDAESVR